ncbi:MAG: N-acetyl-gamma-glutamyl-phosphate reductase [Ferruginibacter sp.]
MSSKIRAGVVGGAGYTGGELIRILLHHPLVDIRFIHSTSNAGKPIYAVHQDLLGDTAITFSETLHADIDVLFLCMGHGEANKFLTQNAINASIKIIDLSQDFRLAATAHFEERAFVYGLPELNKTAIQSASNIANPGCFATAIQLGLLPLAKAGLLNEVFVTGITGSTGAGQSLSATSHFSWRANNIQAYKTLEHQHLYEIQASLHALQPHFPSTPESGDAIHFVPWRGDFTRGIFCSAQLACNLEYTAVKELFKDFYAEHPFTTVSDQSIFLKQVVHTNKCFIQLEQKGSQLVVHTAIDNLIKGASGQAVQNMNIMFGIEETAGLKLKAGYF